MPYSNVLLIDDDEDDLYFFKDAASSVCPDTIIQTLNDARDALQQLDTGAIAPDLLILDLDMPHMSGVQFLAELRNRPIPLDIPIIVVSSVDRPGTAAAVKALGARDFFAKPDTFLRMKALVQQLLQ